MESEVILKYGILTGKELEKVGILNFQSENEPRLYSNASIDFRLGEEYFFPHLYQKEIVSKNLGGLITEEEQSRLLDGLIYNCASKGYLEIPKFTSVVVETYESLIIPDNVAGRFDLRIKWAISGLVLQVGTQIEPGYKGKLWGLLHNFSNEQIIIKFKDYDHRLFTAEFSYTNEASPPSGEKLKKPLDLKQFLSKYPVKSGSLQNYFEQFEKAKIDVTNQVTNGLTEIRGKIDSKIAEIEQLRKDVGKTNEKVNKSTLRNLQWFFGIMTFFITVVVPIVLSIIITKLTFDKDDFQIFNNSNKIKAIETLQKQIDDLKLTIDKQNAKLDSTQNALKK